MTNSIRTRVGVACAVGSLIVLSACGGSDGGAAADVAPLDGATEDVAGDASDAAASTEPVVENSPSFTVAGETLPQLEDPNNDAAVGMTAPVITGVTFDGSEQVIGGPTDGPTMLVFLAHWCPHCNDEIPEINELRDNGAIPDDLNIVGVSTAVEPDRDNFPPSNWIAEKDWSFPVLADTVESEAFRSYGGSGFPFTVMLNADGTVNARKSGSESADQISDWIGATLLRG